MYYNTWHIWNFGFFGMILVWGLFIWFIIWLVSQNKQKTMPKDSVIENPYDILKLRLAKGEINKKEYNDIVKKL